MVIRLFLTEQGPFMSARHLLAAVVSLTGVGSNIITMNAV